MLSTLQATKTPFSAKYAQVALFWNVEINCTGNVMSHVTCALSTFAPLCVLGCVRLGSIRNKNNWNNASKRLFGSYSHSRIPGFPLRYPFLLFYSQEQNSRNIFRNKFLFRNIPNERALKFQMAVGAWQRIITPNKPSARKDQILAQYDCRDNLRRWLNLACGVCM